MSLNDLPKLDLVFFDIVHFRPLEGAINETVNGRTITIHVRLLRRVKASRVGGTAYLRSVATDAMTSLAQPLGSTDISFLKKYAKGKHVFCVCTTIFEDFEKRVPFSTHFFLNFLPYETTKTFQRNLLK